MAKVVGFIEFSWGAGIAMGPLIAEVLYNQGGIRLPLYLFSLLMLFLAIFTYFTMDRSVEGLPDDLDSSSNIQNDERVYTEDSNNASDSVHLKDKISIWSL